MCIIFISVLIWVSFEEPSSKFLFIHKMMTFISPTLNFPVYALLRPIKAVNIFLLLVKELSQNLINHISNIYISESR